MAGKRKAEAVGLMRPAATWQGDTVAERLVMCVRMLVIHGALTERERDAAMARIRKELFRGR